MVEGPENAEARLEIPELYPGGFVVRAGLRRHVHRRGRRRRVVRRILSTPFGPGDDVCRDTQQWFPLLLQIP